MDGEMQLKKTADNQDQFHDTSDVSTDVTYCVQEVFQQPPLGQDDWSPCTCTYRRQPMTSPDMHANTSNSHQLIYATQSQPTKLYSSAQLISLIFN